MFLFTINNTKNDKYIKHIKKRRTHAVKQLYPSRKVF